MIFGKLLLATIESKMDAVTLRSCVFTLCLAEQPSRFLADAQDVGHRLSESRKQPSRPAGSLLSPIEFTLSMLISISQSSIPSVEGACVLGGEQSRLVVQPRQSQVPRISNRISKRTYSIGNKKRKGTVPVYHTSVLYRHRDMTPFYLDFATSYNLFPSFHDLS
jgi:hypothetical protein